MAAPGAAVWVPLWLLLAVACSVVFGQDGIIVNGQLEPRALDSRYLTWAVAASVLAGLGGLVVPRGRVVVVVGWAVLTYLLSRPVRQKPTRSPCLSSGILPPWPSTPPANLVSSGPDAGSATTTAGCTSPPAGSPDATPPPTDAGPASN